jgi:hypothetical protein
MKSFTALSWDGQRCRREIEQLRALLARRQSLTERQHILPLIRKCVHLSAFLGSYHPGIDRFDRIAFEYELFGDFRCDLVGGDSVKHAYAFIEFEGAGPDSLFKRQGQKRTREGGR